MLPRAACHGSTGCRSRALCRRGQRRSPRGRLSPVKRLGLGEHHGAALLQANLRGVPYTSVLSHALHDRPHGPGATRVIVVLHRGALLGKWDETGRISRQWNRPAAPRKPIPEAESKEISGPVEFLWRQ